MSSALTGFCTPPTDGLCALDMPHTFLDLSMLAPHCFVVTLSSLHFYPLDIVLSLFQHTIFSLSSRCPSNQFLGKEKNKKQHKKKASVTIQQSFCLS